MPPKQAKTKSTKQASKKTTPTETQSRREWTEREKKVILNYLLQTIQSGLSIEVRNLLFCEIIKLLVQFTYLLNNLIHF